MTPERIALIRSKPHRPDVAALMDEVERLRADGLRLDFLESFVNSEGGIVLHDGSFERLPFSGLGLRPGFLNRTLREAIDQCGAVKTADGTVEHVREGE